jgi:glycosyltransferase involved in cell wall biosynthesis
MESTRSDEARSPARPRLSAIICTRNRPDKIGQAVASVLASDHAEFDLTVVDQSTSDATASIVRRIGDARLRYLHSEVAGLSRAYNTAIRSTSGTILAFTDDDCIVPVDWLSNIERAFEAEPDADLLYGQVLPAHDGTEALTPLLEIERPERLSRRDGFRVFGMGANFAARRRLFEQIGPFDEVLGGGGPLRSSQDYDLAYRAYRGDTVILLRPEVALRHDGRREEEDWPALLTSYGIGDGAFYCKHVRCHDGYAAWLLTNRLVGQVGRSAWKRARRRGGGGEATYVRGVLKGIRGSFEFDVDRTSRLYVEG